MECWRHFVHASRLLCKLKLCADEIRLADAFLLQFCSCFQILYGEDSVTPNIHLHAHVTECISDFGPMSSFWLFSFEHFNGLLGDEPTNNRSIEVQLMNRFVKDNAHIGLLSSVPSASDDITGMFSEAVMAHAFNFTSTKHLDVSESASVSVGDHIIPASKYTISSFDKPHMEVLTNLYREIYPSLIDTNIYLPQSYWKMSCVTIHGQKVSSGQYI